MRMADTIVMIIKQSLAIKTDATTWDITGDMSFICFILSQGQTCSDISKILLFIFQFIGANTENEINITQLQSKANDKFWVFSSLLAVLQWETEIETKRWNRQTGIYTSRDKKRDGEQLGTWEGREGCERQRRQSGQEGRLGRQAQDRQRGGVREKRHKSINLYSQE